MSNYNEIRVSFDNKNYLTIDEGKFYLYGEERDYENELLTYESQEYDINVIIDMIEEHENNNETHEKEIERLNKEIKDLSDHNSHQKLEYDMKYESQRQRIENFIKENKELKKNNEQKENTIKFYREEFGAKEE